MCGDWVFYRETMMWLCWQEESEGDDYEGEGSEEDDEEDAEPLDDEDEEAAGEEGRCQTTIKLIYSVQSTVGTK